MALRDFLYACPFCGRSLLRWTGPRVRCRGCLRSYAPGETAGAIRVVEPGEAPSEIPAAVLARKLQALNGSLVTGPREEGQSFLESEVTARFSIGEEPLRFRRSLLGFVERLGPARAGVLQLSERELRFTEREGRLHTWELRNLRALQASSSSIQVSPLRGGVVAFRFRDTSPRVWEELLKERLREVWLDEGRGEIGEFQPRIR